MAQKVHVAVRLQEEDLRELDFLVNSYPEVTRHFVCSLAVKAGLEILTPEDIETAMHQRFRRTRWTLDEIRVVLANHFVRTGKWPTGRKFSGLASAARRRGSSLPLLIEELGGPKAKITVLFPKLTKNKRKLVPFLPPFEQELIQDYYSNNKTQAEIAQKHDITQAAVSYRLKISHKRLDFLQRFPRITQASLKRLLQSAGFEDPTIRILSALYKTTCQLTAADKTGNSQGKVRHQLHRAVEKLETLVASGRDDLKEVLLGLTMVRDQSGALHTYVHPARKKRIENTVKGERPL
jgi:predicted transcriptional regulator